jgi:hypothetical protein
VSFNEMAAVENFDAWLTQLRQFWSTRVSALERYLDRITDHGPDCTADRNNQSTPKNGKAKR